MTNGRQWFTVRRDEEGACACCGAPLYVGDSALFDQEMQRVYCGNECSDIERGVVLMREGP